MLRDFCRQKTGKQASKERKIFDFLGSGSGDHICISGYGPNFVQRILFSFTVFSLSNFSVIGGDFVKFSHKAQN